MPHKGVPWQKGVAEADTHAPWFGSYTWPASGAYIVSCISGKPSAASTARIWCVRPVSMSSSTSKQPSPISDTRVIRCTAYQHTVHIHYKVIYIRLKPVLFGFPRSVVKATMVIIYIYKDAHKLPSANYPPFSITLYTPKTERLERKMVDRLRLVACGRLYRYK